MPGVGRGGQHHPAGPPRPTPNGPRTPTQEIEVAICWDLGLLKRPQKFLQQRVGGGVEVGGVGQHVGMLFVGGPWIEQGPLHVLAGGGALWRAVLTLTRTSPWLRRTSSHLSTRASLKALPA